MCLSPYTGWQHLTLLMVMTSISLSAWCQGTEADLRAAFIYNIAKYVDWPADALRTDADGLALCMVGRQNELIDALSALDGKLVKGQPLKVRHAARNDNHSTCQILVMTDSEAEYFTPILRRLEGMPVLTVNGSERFLDAGGAISLVPEGRKIRFDINLAATRRNNLVLSSQLLKLARTVRQP